VCRWDQFDDFIEHGEIVIAPLGTNRDCFILNINQLVVIGEETFGPENITTIRAFRLCGSQEFVASEMAVDDEEPPCGED
jgi:hypothetical protein